MPNTPKLPPDVERRFDEWRQSGQSYMNPQDFVDGWHQGRLKQFIAQELDNLKAQLRKEIEGLKNKHSSGQGWTNHLEIGYKDGITDCLSIPSLEEEE